MGEPALAFLLKKPPKLMTPASRVVRDAAMTTVATAVAAPAPEPEPAPMPTPTEILKHLEGNPASTVDGMSQALKCTPAALRRHLTLLSKRNQVHRVGSSQKTRWHAGPAAAKAATEETPAQMVARVAAAKERKPSPPERSGGGWAAAAAAVTKPLPPTHSMVLVVDGDHVETYTNVDPTLLTSVSVILNRATTGARQ